jgi:hypothetical protein
MYPINSSELTRRMGYRDDTDEFSHMLQQGVRPALRRLHCPKAGPAVRSPWVIDREMAERVAAICGHTLR